MKYISRTSLYHRGTSICEQKILPFLIWHIEPVRPKDKMPATTLLEINLLATDYEIRQTFRNYQLVGKGLILGLIFLLSLITIGISKLLELVSSLITIPELVSLILLILCWLAFSIAWMGVYSRIKSRRTEWQDIMTREIILERLEYSAKIVGSAIVAELIIEIEKQKKNQAQESKITNDFKSINEILKTDTLKTFDSVMNKREGKNKWKTLATGIGGFLAGYFAEKSLDAVLFSKFVAPNN